MYLKTLFEQGLSAILVIAILADFYSFYRIWRRHKKGQGRSGLPLVGWLVYVIYCSHYNAWLLLLGLTILHGISRICFPLFLRKYF